MPFPAITAVSNALQCLLLLVVWPNTWVMIGNWGAFPLITLSECHCTLGVKIQNFWLSSNTYMTQIATTKKSPMVCPRWLITFNLQCGYIYQLGSYISMNSYFFLSLVSRVSYLAKLGKLTHWQNHCCIVWQQYS